MKNFPTLCCVCAIFAASVGCSSLNTNGHSWNPMKSISASKDNQAASIEPNSMAIIWKDSVYEQPGATSIKGFGGRLYIYDANNRPVKADGELVIYGYDETNSGDNESPNKGADKKFVFPRETLQRHFSDSDLGPSYSVWIPWEEVGGLRKSVTLIPILKTTGGSVLRCGQSMTVLPGRKPKTANANINGNKITNTPNLIAQASFQQATANQGSNHISSIGTSSTDTNLSANKPNIRTTTFSVPPSLGKKMSSNQAPIRAPTENSFPRPDVQIEPSSKAAQSFGQASGPSDATSNPLSELPQPAPRIFGMPGSF